MERSSRRWTRIATLHVVKRVHRSGWLAERPVAQTGPASGGGVTRGRLGMPDVVVSSDIGGRITAGAQNPAPPRKRTFGSMR
jgi:hypothetical protein